MRGFKTTSLAIIFSLVTALSAPSAFAMQTFDQWLEGFKREAISQGIDPNIVDQSLSNLQPNQKVIDYDDPAVQPETRPSLSFAEYANKRVNARISKGQQMLRQHYSLLKRIGDHYGVQPQYIVALWGMETNFGSHTGNFDIIRSLATLSWHHSNNLSNPSKAKRAARRYKLFNAELINTLRIIEQGHYTRASMKGSWAGAFGQVQFMPSSFLNLSADGDGDGKNDIRNNLADAFASAANYLAKNGWKDGQRWGRQVIIPAGMSASLVGQKKTLAQWEALGMKTMAGNPIPVEPGMRAELVAPDGLSGQVFLVYNNFNTIMRWNRSHKFALSVGLLADKIAAAAPSPSGS